MASTTITSISATSADVKINLSQPFNTSWYVKAGVSEVAASSGQSNRPFPMYNQVDAPTSGTNTYATFTVVNLTPNTSYTFYGWAQAADNLLYYPAGYVNFNTSPLPPPPVPPTPTSVTLLPRLESGFVVGWSEAGSLATSFSVKARRGYDNSTTYYTVSGSSTRSYNLTGLNYSTGYYISVKAVGSSGSSSYSSEVYSVTAPQTPNLGVSGITSTSAVIQFSASGVYSSGTMRLYRQNTSTLLDTKYVSANSYETFTGLTVGVGYYVLGFTTNSSGIVSVGNGSVVFTTENRPTNWTLFTMTSGSAMPTYLGNPSPCTAIRWNAFTNKINEFRTYKSVSLYTFSTAYIGQNATATLINQARTAISGMSPPTSVPPAVSSSGGVLASTLVGLQSSLNSIP